MDETIVPHGLTLDARKKLTMTGALEVVRFEENAVLLRTSLGLLLVEGRELKLRTLTPEGGRLTVEGEITALAYAGNKTQGGWLGRLLR